MSVLERTNHEFYRVFEDGDALPTQWDALTDRRISDAVVVIEHEVVVQPPESPATNATIEGLGWVMLAHGS